MKSGSVLVVLLALAPACRRHGGVTTDHQVDGAVSERDAAPPADESTRPADLAVDLATIDVGPPLPGEDAYRDFIGRYNEAIRRRLVNCFNFSPTTIARDTYREVMDSIIGSLRAGLVKWDDTLAARCLGSIASASCEDFASGRALAACERVLAGQVSDDGYCLDDHDCREPGRVCGGSGLGTCGSVCQRSLDPGRALAGDGQDCIAENCQPGLYCRNSAYNSGEGICRSIAPGAPCDSRWQCPYPYTCTGQAAGMGSCGPGKIAGQACHVWTEQPTPGLDSDCAPTSRCEATATGSEVCVPNPPSGPTVPTIELPVGAVCLTNEKTGRCRLGTFCRVDPAELQKEPPPPTYQGVCQPWRKLGDPCEDEGACAPAQTCLHGACTMCPGAPGPSVDGGAPDAAPAGDGGCAASLKSDPANCGACGHGCLGGACFDGHCQPRSIGGGLDREIAGMAVDETGVYLTEDVMNGRVLRVTPDGSQPYQVLASGQNQPEGIAVDATHVYWVNFSGSVGGTVNRVPKGGGPVEILAPQEAGPTRIALDGTHAYWTNTSEGPLGGLRRVAKLGGPPEPFVPGISPGDVVLDATDVYWSDYGNGTVSRRSKLRGPVKVLASGEESASRMALDDRRVYWTSFKHIASVAKGGGAIEELSLDSGQDLAADGEAVYWATSSAIGRAGAGGALQLLDASDLHEIEVRGPWVYFVAGGSLLRTPK